MCVCVCVCFFFSSSPSFWTTTHQWDSFSTSSRDPTSSDCTKKIRVLYSLRSQTLTWSFSFSYFLLCFLFVLVVEAIKVTQDENKTTTHTNTHNYTSKRIYTMSQKSIGLPCPDVPDVTDFAYLCTTSIGPSCLAIDFFGTCDNEVCIDLETPAPTEAPKWESENSASITGTWTAAGLAIATALFFRMML